MTKALWLAARDGFIGLRDNPFDSQGLSALRGYAENPYAWTAFSVAKAPATWPPALTQAGCLTLKQA